jgi:hypothetical protein
MGFARLCILSSLLALALSAPAQASTGQKPAQAMGKASAKAQKKAAKPGKPAKRLPARAAAAKARAETRAKAEADAIAAGKAAVFVFQGDESEPLRRHVIRLLRANGMRVQTDLRPNDTAEQFRDMAAALDLAVYVHGRVKDAPSGRSLVTITIRSGVTGRTVATASFAGQRRELSTMIEDGLWQKVRAPLARACLDAHSKPRRHNAPMRIEAGTPLEDAPRRADGT